jgi:hypothetical protein
MADYNTITSDFPRSNVTYGAVTIQITGPVTEYDVKANTNLFRRINWAREFVLRNSGAISVKLNSLDNDAIDLFANEGINTNGVSIGNVYITSIDDEAIVRIIITGYN